jgi:iduronate 2-sulfatase
MKNPIFWALTLCLVAACSKQDATGPVDQPKKPNILFIIADDLRNDLGAYGAEFVVSPHLDRLAKTSIVFNHAYCQKAVCWPSRNSFFSGLMPASLGKGVGSANTFRVEHPTIVALPELFKRHGWFTRGFGKILHNGQDDPQSWSEPLFTPEPLHYAAEENLEKHPIINRAAPENRVNPLFESADVEEDAYEDGLTANAAVKAIREAGKADAPFFMMVGFHKPHTPFNAPKKYWDLYERSAIPLAPSPEPPLNVDERYAVHNSNYVRSFKDIPDSGQLPDELAREIRHAYYACISYVDALVGDVLAALEETGQREDTIIVFTSDHGYQLGDHSLWSKHTNFELATRVPLFVSVPNSLANGTTTDALIELVDLFPTLAELCGLESPEHVEGVSFASIFGGQKTEVRDTAFSEFTRNGARGCSIRTSRFRYIEWRDHKTGDVVAQELYDHSQDPGENVNIAGEAAYASIRSHLAVQLEGRK